MQDKLLENNSHPVRKHHNMIASVNVFIFLSGLQSFYLQYFGDFYENNFYLISKLVFLWTVFFIRSSSSVKKFRFVFWCLAVIFISVIVFIVRIMVYFNSF